MEEEGTRSIERGDNRQGEAFINNVPAAVAYCQVGLSEKKGKDNEMAEYIWVPGIVQELSE